MAEPKRPLIFDGHNDQLSLLALGGRANAAERFTANPTAAIDVRRARLGGFGGGFFAVWVPSTGVSVTDFSAMVEAPFDVPLPEPVPICAATALAMEQMAILFALERAGHLRVCRTAGALRQALAEGVMAAVLHMEGAEAIDPGLVALDVFHAAGLRSLGPVWSRPNAFGHGVPFRFPASPDTGPGLTPHGEALVKRCDELGIMVDCSHLTEAGFWDVVRLSTKPIVATHSNAHALCPSARNLTDAQLEAIRASGGMVGVNFATAFLRADGCMATDVPFEQILAHIDHLLAKLGEDGVGFGSDYDGAVVPASIRGVEGLPRLRKAMIAHGYGDALMAKLCHENWLNLLERTWGR